MYFNHKRGVTVLLSDLDFVTETWKEIEKLETKIQEMKDIAERITTSYSATPKSKANKDRLAEAIETRLMYENMTLDKYTLLYEQKIILTKFINSLDDPIVCTALKMKYDTSSTEAPTWQDISKKFGHDFKADSIRRACTRALKVIDMDIFKTFAV